jgi:lysophospholipase L1-like esterase
VTGGAGGTAGASTVAGGSGGIGTARGGSSGSAGASSAAGGSDSAGGAAGAGVSAGAGGLGLAGTGGAAVNQGALPATTLHLAGDSTVMYYAPPSAQEGWGQELAQFFIPKITIDNQALGGASVQTFHDGSRWANIMSALRAGDYVMADFGINDSGTVAGRSVTPTNFQKLMLQMSNEVKAKGATFIIVTPSALQYWSGGMDGNTRLAPYVAVENSLGAMNQIPIDDLNARSLEFLDMIGQTAAMQIYINGDKAHFTKQGATKMAELVAAELRRIGNPLAQYLK